MVSTSIVSPCPEQVTQNQPNGLENACSPTDMQATNVQVRAAFALARRERDATLRANPQTIQHIRQLIALECTRVDRFPTVGGAA